MTDTKSTPIVNSKSTPLALSSRLGRNSQYVSSDEITKLAINVYKNNGGRGITYTYLIEAGLTDSKAKAQDMKYHKRKGTIFTLQSLRPQQYYPTAIKSNIIENLTKSTQIDPTGVPSSTSPSISKFPLSNCMEPVVLQTLEGYVLPLLPKAPLFIHNMHFKTKIARECYEELNLPMHDTNHGKYHTEIIGNTRVNYIFYSSGIVNVDTSCSNIPYKLETEQDRSRIIAFFGQIRDRLIQLLHDVHERLVPDIMNWYMPECDINKDIKVGSILHFSAIKVQVKHLDHIFSVYIKSLGKDTVCRVEERKHSRDKPAVDVIDDVFNPIERVERRLAEHDTKLDEINGKLTILVNNKGVTGSKQSEIPVNM
jgi:hypothetical protein